MTTGRANSEVIQGWIDSYNNQDVAAMADHFADDVTWTHQGSIDLSGVYRGSRNVIDDFIKPGWALYQPGTLRLELNRVICDDSTAAVEFTARGVALATGRDYVSPYAMFVDINEGRITEVREYVDTAHAKEILFG